MPEEYEDLFELLTTAQQQAVARGDVGLEELLEIVTRPVNVDDELCPRCSSRPIGNDHGLCDVCWRRELNHRLEDKLAEVAAQRDADRIKQETCRHRRVLGTNPRRRAPNEKTSEDYGGKSLITTDEGLPLVACTACGETFRQHDAEQTTCFPCQERAAERDYSRARRCEA